MKSFIHLDRGDTPRHAHRDLEGRKEEEMSRAGFAGRSTVLYHSHDPTTFRADGPLKVTEWRTHRLATDDLTDPAGRPRRVLSNADCTLSISRRSEAMPFLCRNVDGDEVYFVHRGTGTFRTEFGPVPYEPGDYVVLPKSTTYQVVPDTTDNHFLVTETYGELQLADFTSYGRRAPFDPTILFVPEPDPVADADHDGSEVEVRIRYRGQDSSIFYPYHPFDVHGWKGDLFPFKLNIRDWNVMTSETLHLPPSVHFFLQAPGVVVLHFLPRPAEAPPGVERVPWYHRNVDYDEVTLTHGGSFLGYPLPRGALAHSPQGLHHGAPEVARDHARATHDEYDRVDWEIISVDTVRPLLVDAESLAAVQPKPERADGPGKAGSDD